MIETAPFVPSMYRSWIGAIISLMLDSMPSCPRRGWRHAGELTIREIEYHDDDIRDTIKAPVVVLSLYGPNGAKIGAKVRYLVNGKWLREYGRW